jgi:hydrogenase maturation protein HypF
MYPSLEAVREDCAVSELEERLLLSPESPIVLLRRLERRASTTLCASVAPGNPNLGVMLAYTPLHHLLLRELGFPIVATSGNLSDEPICTAEDEALERLSGIADAFLVHDRPIVRHVDDSIVRVVRGRELVLRRARGYAPLPVHLPVPLPCVLAVAAHLKKRRQASAGMSSSVSTSVISRPVRHGPHSGKSRPICHSSTTQHPTRSRAICTRNIFQRSMQRNCRRRCIPSSTTGRTR